VQDIQRIAKDLGETFTIDEIKEMVQEADHNGKPLPFIPYFNFGKEVL
jgi:hypothetical protein